MHLHPPTVPADVFPQAVCRRTRRAARRASGPPGAVRRPEDPVLQPYCVMRFTGRLIICHSPVSLLYVQLQNASQFLLSMAGLSARK